MMNRSAPKRDVERSSSSWGRGSSSGPTPRASLSSSLSLSLLSSRSSSLSSSMSSSSFATIAAITALARIASSQKITESSSCSCCPTEKEDRGCKKFPPVKMSKLRSSLMFSASQCDDNEAQGGEECLSRLDQRREEEKEALCTGLLSELRKRNVITGLAVEAVAGEFLRRERGCGCVDDDVHCRGSSTAEDEDDVTAMGSGIIEAYIGRMRNVSSKLSSESSCSQASTVPSPHAPIERCKRCKRVGSCCCISPSSNGTITALRDDLNLKDISAIRELAEAAAADEEPFPTTSAADSCDAQPEKRQEHIEHQQKTSLEGSLLCWMKALTEGLDAESESGLGSSSVSVSSFATPRTASLRESYCSFTSYSSSCSSVDPSVLEEDHMGEKKCHTDPTRLPSSRSSSSSSTAGSTIPSLASTTEQEKSSLLLDLDLELGTLPEESHHASSSSASSRRSSLSSSGSRSLTSISPQDAIAGYDGDVDEDDEMELSGANLFGSMALSPPSYSDVVRAFGESVGSLRLDQLEDDEGKDGDGDNSNDSKKKFSGHGSVSRQLAAQSA